MILRPFIIFVAVLATSAAEAAVKIPVSRETMHVLAILSVVVLLSCALVCFYKRMFLGGLVFLGMIVFPFAIGAIFAFAGVPVRWW